MRFCVLASGSGGNACYFETPRSRILVDAGLSCREILRRLKLVGIDPGTLNALILTHEHFDHIRGAGALARRLDIPVYMNQPTFQRGMRTLGNLSRPVPIRTGQVIVINGLVVETFTKCHDAADPMGVVISCDGVRVGLLTDLGRSTPLVEDRLRGCQALIIESNHDEKMLDEGPYPLEVKRRIKGPEGHLSNTQAAELLEAVSHEALNLVVLAHLSAQNNLPEKALSVAEKTLKRGSSTRVKILISYQDDPMPMVEI
ncbi:MAG: MBL fold metallo-hydrolase [Deltaproteobacteria bacterium]|nr:MBL fold metallo-hydrolase [Deltaproteobacteria bacterium]MBW1936614.1 MBL fold metallo-hydrolase [Deltaproteobacteria bacterium]MBW1977041.1 MBL fold metallo-hydrolase [Deltaproteobacteria bacterium]MBW2045061.1 MBL fold metallo-hydrolase [Deltaproteobacteria bacterium]MBW2300563.1 MBL fold metallo-hydrolase [Deltaproteobacteria bacterium]